MSVAVEARKNLINVNSENFEELVLNHPGAVLVDFWAEWCGPCRMLGPVLEETADYFGDKLRVAKVNVDENPTLANLFKVQSIPSLKLIHNGQLAGEWTGLTTAEKVRSNIETALAAKTE